MRAGELKALLADVHDDATVVIRSWWGEPIEFAPEEDRWDVGVDIDDSCGDPEDDLVVVRVSSEFD